MRKLHAPHPTQHAACGAPHYVSVVAESVFRSMSTESVCRRCAKVLAALDAGRPVYSGYEDPDTGERGARKVSS